MSQIAPYQRQNGSFDEQSQYDVSEYSGGQIPGHEALFPLTAGYFEISDYGNKVDDPFDGIVRGCVLGAIVTAATYAALALLCSATEFASTIHRQVPDLMTMMKSAIVVIPVALLAQGRLAYNVAQESKSTGIALAVSGCLLTLGIAATIFAWPTGG